MANTNSDSLLPLTNRRHPSPQNVVNAGNSCYLDALIVAMFAEFDAWDSLLHTSKPIANVLRPYVNQLRLGQQVSKYQVETTRQGLIKHANWYKGKSQQDAAELFATLLDHLHAPFVPLVRNLIHNANADPADHSPFTERLIWLRSPQYSSTDTLHQMLHDYFLGGTLHVNRHGASQSSVAANVCISLIPSYTSQRETGETVSASRLQFHTLVVPLAIRRFAPDSNQKITNKVEIQTAISAANYVEPFAHGKNHILILKSIVCHLGSTIKYGHYVAYTYSTQDGWRRWDDLCKDPVRSVPGNVKTGMPIDKKWADEIAQNCYLLFYELVPGDDDTLASLSLELKKKSNLNGDSLLADQMQWDEIKKGTNVNNHHPSQESLDGEMAVQMQAEEIGIHESSLMNRATSSSMHGDEINSYNSSRTRNR